jgi:hypothetical protein
VNEGERGPAGPSLVGGAKSDSGTIGPIAGTMVDLASGATTTGQVVLPWTGLITANGFADVTTSAATTSRTRCNLFISDGTGPNNGLAVFRPNSFGDTPATNNYGAAGLPVKAGAPHVFHRSGAQYVATSARSEVTHVQEIRRDR